MPSKGKNTTPVPVRFDQVTKGRLRRAASRMGSNSSAVIRFAVLKGLDEIESGHFRLPAPQAPGK
jgi:predicted DNA-binding protein